MEAGSQVQGNLLDAVKVVPSRVISFFNPPFGFYGTDGGAGGGGATGGGGGASTTGTTTSGTTTGTSASTTNGGATGDEGGKGDDGKGDKDDDDSAKGPDGKPWDPERAGRTINRMRDERKREKAEFDTFKSDHQKTMDGLAVALGFKKDEVNPEKLQQELGGKISTLESENRSLKLQIAVDRASFSKNVVAELMWPQLHNSGALKNIDLEASDLEDQIGTKIDEALTKYPQLRRSGPGATRDAGARGDGNLDESTNVNDMIRRAAGRSS